MFDDGLGQLLSVGSAFLEQLVLQFVMLPLLPLSWFSVLSYLLFRLAGGQSPGGLAP